ncbi:hypothetical protein FHT44_005060 [Mycolicibacterium sp. BK634]|uniref:hypothetical protein n=1 Tax=Mycolicibacterium sp. BK634 TaxID=2587099 RepID=UPI0016216C1E|nr:hypothetical protein [Mycolicibacterium sp. BK634]MBB3752548.1 hypothetical protein [Mycolicibacterium sp. BK634]
MTALDTVRKLVAANPRHAVTAAKQFEKLYREDPNHAGYRQIYWELQRQVDEQFPITRPVEIDPPDEAWDDESHPFWSTDPWTLFDMTFNRLRDEMGWVEARVHVSNLQRAGQDIIRSAA